MVLLLFSLYVIVCRLSYSLLSEKKSFNLINSFEFQLLIFNFSNFVNKPWLSIIWSSWYIGWCTITRTKYTRITFSSFLSISKFNTGFSSIFSYNQGWFTGTGSVLAKLIFRCTPIISSYRLI